MAVISSTSLNDIAFRAIQAIILILFAVSNRWMSTCLETLLFIPGVQGLVASLKTKGKDYQIRSLTLRIDHSIYPTFLNLNKTTIIPYPIFPPSYQSIQHFHNSMSKYLKHNLSSMLSFNMLSEINHEEEEGEEEEEDLQSFQKNQLRKKVVHRHINPEYVSLDCPVSYGICKSGSCALSREEAIFQEKVLCVACCVQ
jgi:hypothetical protein